MNVAEPIPFVQMRYRCPSCRRSWANKKRAREHVARCQRNPAIRGCGTCAHDFETLDGSFTRYACSVDARPGDVTCIRDCPQWKAK